MRVFSGPGELAAAVGSELGASEWIVIEQGRIDRFAEATGDYQWIHIDEAQAKEGPFGSTIAHGFLTLSLLPMLTGQIYRVDGVRMGINYGLNRVRFVSPVRVGSTVRAVMTLASLEELPDAGAIQITGNVIVEIEGAEKPAAVAETLTRFYL